MPKEDISFANFKFEEIVNEEWDESNFKDILEHKGLSNNKVCRID
ncbi:MAG: hypothetical protein RBR97_00715 [Bacteroidales bacterium]|nr:hypothetical protein [Bacteroidales bacterium]